VNIQQPFGDALAQGTVGETEQAFFFFLHVEGDQPDELGSNGKIPVEGIQEFVFGEEGDLCVFQHLGGIFVGSCFPAGQVTDIVAGNIEISDIFFPVFIDAEGLDLAALYQV
jgi:hypothetical protein